MFRRAALMLAGILMGLLSAGIFSLVSSKPRGHAVALLHPPTPGPVQVHVCGAVNQPGVYALPRGSIVEHAIEAAGGFTPEAVPSALNLAAVLEDGQKVHVPEQENHAVSIASSAYTTVDPAPGELININTATASELDLLPGIGPSLANNIIEHRQNYGPFTSIEDIINVSGIGPAKFAELRDLITVH
ncbi:MAG TPA: ComEA family DNA-binding protein [Anaerolineae bacterium]|nr:ComEA family DNA-binding protein [Anaerolineae bacterium]